MVDCATPFPRLVRECSERTRARLQRHGSVAPAAACPTSVPLKAGTDAQDRPGARPGDRQGNLGADARPLGAWVRIHH
jgi:hypothetical protein